MKKTLLTTLLLSPLFLLAQEVNYKLNGKLGAGPEVTTAYMTYRTPSGSVTDSAQIQNGQFQFAGKVAESVKATVFAGKDLRSAQRSGGKAVYLENGDILVTSPDSVRNASVSGGPLNRDNAHLEEALKPIREKSAELTKMLREASEEERKSDAFGEKYRNISGELSKQQTAIQTKFIADHPNSQISLELIGTVVGYAPDIEDVEKYFNPLSDAVKNSPAGQRYQKTMEKIRGVSVGKIAPDFTQNDTIGNPVSLSDFRGKYVLIDFWASWCGPCRMENPNLVAAYHQFKERGFTVLGVSLDQPGKHDAWMKAIHDDKLEWTQVSDLKFWENEVAVLYNIRAIPQNFLIDPDGKIIAKNLRGEELAPALEKFLK